MSAASLQSLQINSPARFNCCHIDSKWIANQPAFATQKPSFGYNETCSDLSRRISNLIWLGTKTIKIYVISLKTIKKRIFKSYLWQKT
jgi:hypothetical protein